MSLLFEEGKHFLGYKDKNELKEKMEWAVTNPGLAQLIAFNGYNEVRKKHFVTHRLDRILEVVR
jgi:spore maturation protein CgeB